MCTLLHTIRTLASIYFWYIKLKALESAAEGGGLSEEERERKSVLCRDLERALLQEEISWR